MPITRQLVLEDPFALINFVLLLFFFEVFVYFVKLFLQPECIQCLKRLSLISGSLTGPTEDNKKPKGERSLSINTRRLKQIRKFVP